MEEARFYPKLKKPRIIFDKRFPYFTELEVGDKGQLRARLQVEEERMVMNEVGNEMKHLTLLVLDSDLITSKSVRI